MSRYIVREYIGNVISNLPVEVFYKEGKTLLLVPITKVINVIKDAPSIDIVQCGECKYDGTWKCPWRNTQVPRYPSANDFCSYGEREGE